MTHDGHMRLEAQMTAPGAVMQLCCLFTNSNMMRHSEIHANSVFSLVIYFEQRVSLSYKVFNEDCFPVKFQSAAVCVSDSFTFRHLLFHMETYSKTTALKH